MEHDFPAISTGTSFNLAPIAAEEQEIRRRHDANRQAWNEGAEHYTAGLNDAVDFLRAGSSSIHAIEKTLLGDLASWCQTAIHLQCASGRDTISLCNEGVKNVVGIDISDVHIQNATTMARALGAPAQFIRSDVLDVPEWLDGSADLVYTGRGAIYWLHNLNAWAKVIFRLLKPGGRLLLFDSHPFAWLLDTEASDWRLLPLNYFAHCESSRGWPTSYIGNMGRPEEQHAQKFERLWPLSSIFQALRQAGLHIDHLGEYADAYWGDFPHIKSEVAHHIPRTFSIVAYRPLA